MIIEGLPTFVLGIACWFILADSPETAYYLNEDEKAMIVQRRNAQIGISDIFEWKDARKGLKDWKIYVMCAGQFCTDNMLYTYSTFLPTIIEGIKPNSSSATVQAYTIPCYAVGAIVYMSAARFSDWTQIRGPVVACLSLISIIGYALLISPLSFEAHYAGCFLVAFGLYVAVGVSKEMRIHLCISRLIDSPKIPLAWLPSNNPRYGKRTTASRRQIMTI